MIYIIGAHSFPCNSLEYFHILHLNNNFALIMYVGKYRADRANEVFAVSCIAKWWSIRLSCMKHRRIVNGCMNMSDGRVAHRYNFHFRYSLFALTVVMLMERKPCKAEKQMKNKQPQNNKIYETLKMSPCV